MVEKGEIIEVVEDVIGEGEIIRDGKEGREKAERRMMIRQNS